LLFLLALPCRAIEAQPLTLNNGDRLSGKVVEENAQQIVLDHPVLGRLVIERDKIAALATTEATESSPANPAPPIKQRNSTSPTPAVSTTVSQRIELGLSGASGNSRNSDLRLGYQRRSDSAEHHSLLKSGYQRESSDGKTEEHDFFTELTHDWLMPQSQWFRFAQGRYDWDDFEDWDSRVAVSGGSGYLFADRPDLRMAGRLGLGLSQTFGGDEDELSPEAIVGFDSNWQVNDRQSLEASNTLYLQLDELGEFRNLTSLAWLIKLDQFNGLNLKFGAENEYESDTGGDSQSNDFKYNLSLTWELK
jgi:putative salt-induced outer membrane protein YdiY